MKLRTAVEIWCSTQFEKILIDLVILGNESRAGSYKHLPAITASFINKILEPNRGFTTGFQDFLKVKPDLLPWLP
jgi:hypothetical protein